MGDTGTPGGPENQPEGERAGERRMDGDGGHRSATGGGDRWQRQVNTWKEVALKFGLEPYRYVDFEYL